MPDELGRRTAGEILARRRRRDAAILGWQRRRRAGFLPSGRRQPHQRTRQQALALAYPARQPSAKKLRELYLADGGNERGAETFIAIVLADWRLYRAKGVHATTTGPRRAGTVERCARTVRRHRRRAELLGVAHYRHVRVLRAGLRRDYLRVEMRSLMSTCLRQQKQRPLVAAASALGDSSSSQNAGTTCGPAPPGQSAGRSAAETREPPFGGKSSTEEGGPRVLRRPELSAEAIAAREQLRIRLGWHEDKWKDKYRQ